MFGKIRHISDQQGFSMAEVVMAMILFSASVLGISGMVMTGASDVARGATDSVAANLAAKRIEEVRSLPFYKAWEGTPKDIDDYYFNTSLEGDKNYQQLDHPKVPEGVEDYGSVPGSTQYKRTTAIQYQQVSSTSMGRAVMDPNWVPSNPSGSQIDRPRNSDGDALHAMIIEVSVYYHISQGGTQHEIVYKLRALEGDMIIPGGASIGPLIVLSIDPAWGATSNKNLPVKIKVSSADDITQPGQTFDVRLWKAGSSDIIGTGTTVTASEIDTHFDLLGIAAGLYNISVYWEQRGWLDKDLRNCFTVVPPPPVIDSVNNFNWGTSRQDSRKVTVSGSNLKNPTTVSLVGPANETVNGTVTSSNDTTIVAKFNLTSVPDSQHGVRWDTKVVTLGGTVVSNADGKRVLMNPQPVVTAITSAPDTSFYRKKKYTNVIVSGRYFGGVGGTNPTVRLTKSGQTDVTDPNVVVGSVTETSDTSMTLSLSTLNLGLSSSSGGGPFTSGNSANEINNWKVVVVNPDAQESTDNVYATLANAPIQITEGWSAQRCWGWDLPLSVKGNYFDLDNTTVSFLDSSGNPCDPTDPSPATTPVPTLTGLEAPEPSGAYDGSAQTISGGLLNLINVPPATYKIRVRDTENGGSVDQNLVVVATNQVPSVPNVPNDINPTSVTNGTAVTLAVRAKWLYGTCSYKVQFEYMIKQGTTYSHYSPKRYTIVTSPTAAVTWSRSEKWVQVSCSITVPSGDIYKTANGAAQATLVTNPTGSSAYGTGYPTVL